MKLPFEHDDSHEPDLSAPADSSVPAWLVDALKPEPLSRELVERIRADWNARPSRPTLRLHWAWAIAPLAAAACAILIIRGPSGSDRSGDGRNIGAGAPSIAATQESQWDSSVSELDAQLVQIGTSVSGHAADSFLPWGSDDDWDLPAAESNSSGAINSSAFSEVTT